MRAKLLPIQPETIFDWGLYLGYPVCCIFHFCDHMRQCRLTGPVPIYPDDDGTQPWIGTGFIPCPCCRKACFEDWPRFVQEIQERRMAGIPAFPDFHDHHVIR